MQIPLRMKQKKSLFHRISVKTYRKKEEDLSSFEITETIEYKLTDKDRYCPDCGTKYKVVTKETVKRLKFIPSTFEIVEEVTYVYSCPKCGTMVRPDKISPLIKGSVATSSLVAGIMNAKYVNGMPLARQEREFARYDLNLLTKKLSRPSGRLTLIIRMITYL